MQDLSFQGSNIQDPFPEGESGSFSGFQVGGEQADLQGSPGFTPTNFAAEFKVDVETDL